MDSIIWAIKHTMRDIADTGLNRMKHITLYLYNKLTDPLFSLPGGCEQLR